MALPTDPLLASQWHLRNATPGLLDLNVFAVWDPTEGQAYTGAGTRTVVIDDGFDYDHVDIAPNYDTFLDFDFEFNTLDPFGSDFDAHGTAVAGIIGAAANGVGAVGVAHGTSLVGYRTAGIISDAWLQDIRDAIHHAAMSAQGDVANISQGIANDTGSAFGVGYAAVRFDEIETSIGTAVGSGRGGLGMTIVKSAGNSRAANFDVNADDWTNDTRQVVVGAVDQNGFVSSYSSYGAALLVSGFGTPGEVLTTDRTGNAGYVAGDYVGGFNGTSAAAPMVAGVVALMYEADTGLGWRDVQSILAASARQVGSDVGAGPAGFERFAWGWNGATTWNGGGLHFSNDYGYGLVDARAAVRLAETWRLTGTPAATSGNEFQNVMDVLNATVVVPDGDLGGLVFSGVAGFDDVVERVTVEMSFSTTWTGDLEVYLTSPEGTTSQLIADTGGSNDFNGTWTFESQAFRGEGAAGAWSVRVIDDAFGDVLTVSDIVIRTFGAFTTDDRYVFTDAYSDYAGIGGHATTINDTNGGIDTVNAGAVTTGSTIRLDGAFGAIDGVAVRFFGVENAIGGDGNDLLHGDGGANQLFGMRGADTIFGAAGDDFIRGGTGNDVITPGAGVDDTDAGAGNDVVFDDDFVNFDVHRGGTGTDRIDYSRVAFASGIVTINLSSGLTSVAGGNTEQILGFENATGSMGGETIIGTSGANTLRGMDGADVLRGGRGADTLIGGRGPDTFDFNSAADSRPGARDVIRAGDGAIAFEGVGVAGGDLIDLADLYAGTLIFGGTGVGRVSVVNSGSNSLVRANLDAAAGFEFELLIADGAGIVAADYRAMDFIL
jgi:subtilisin-like proprotein convertase family protein